MSSGERPTCAAKGKQTDTEALCQLPPPRPPTTCVSRCRGLEGLVLHHWPPLRVPGFCAPLPPRSAVAFGMTAEEVLPCDLQLRVSAICDFLSDPVCTALMHNKMIYTLTNGHFDALPGGWGEALHRMSAPEIRLLAQGHAPPGSPESLIDFVRAATSLALGRAPTAANVVVAGGALQCVQDVVARRHPEPVQPPLAAWMSPKKKHEVEHAADLIKAVCAKLGIAKVIDVGSGEGYLDSVLAYRYGLQVTGIEMQEGRTCGAQLKATRIGARLAQKLFGDNRPSGSGLPGSGDCTRCQSGALEGCGESSTEGFQPGTSHAGVGVCVCCCVWLCVRSAALCVAVVAVCGGVSTSAWLCVLCGIVCGCAWLRGANSR